MFNRDSVVWWVGIVGAVIVGLATLADPATYGIPAWLMPYLRLGALIVGIVSGKMATSPLPGKDKTNLLLAVVLSGALVAPGMAAGCASAPAARTQTQVAQTSLAIAQQLDALQRQEIAAHDQGAITAADHVLWQRSFRSVADAGLALNAALRAGSGPAPPVQRALAAVDALTRDLLPRVPGDRRPAMQLALEAVRSALVVAAAAGGQ